MLVMMNNTLHFESKNNGNIDVDYYRIIVRDNTNLTVYIKEANNTSNTISIVDLFENKVCSPYNVTVQAHNNFGFSEHSINVPMDSKQESRGELANYKLSRKKYI